MAVADGALPSELASEARATGRGRQAAVEDFELEGPDEGEDSSADEGEASAEEGEASRASVRPVRAADLRDIARGGGRRSAGRRGDADEADGSDAPFPWQDVGFGGARPPKGGDVGFGGARPKGDVGFGGARPPRGGDGGFGGARPRGGDVGFKRHSTR